MKENPTICKKVKTVSLYNQWVLETETSEGKQLLSTGCGLWMLWITIAKNHIQENKPKYYTPINSTGLPVSILNPSINYPHSSKLVRENTCWPWPLYIQLITLSSSWMSSLPLKSRRELACSAMVDMMTVTTGSGDEGWEEERMPATKQSISYPASVLTNGQHATRGLTS